MIGGFRYRWLDAYTYCMSDDASNLIIPRWFNKDLFRLNYKNGLNICILVQGYYPLICKLTAVDLDGPNMMPDKSDLTYFSLINVTDANDIGNNKIGLTLNINEYYGYGNRL